MNIGDRCLYFASFGLFSWDEGRFFCSAANEGNLAIIDTVDLFNNVVEYLKNTDETSKI